MKPLDYLSLQMRLEGVQRGSGNFITRTSPGDNEFPLVLQAHTADGQEIVCFDERLPPALYYRLMSDSLPSFKVESAFAVFALFCVPFALPFLPYTSHPLAHIMSLRRCPNP